MAITPAIEQIEPKMGNNISPGGITSPQIIGLTLANDIITQGNNISL